MRGFFILRGDSSPFMQLARCLPYEKMKHTFTSESVSSGHPDKICDQISDTILDEVLRQDPKGRVAVETLVTTNTCVLAGEVTTKATVDFEAIARREIRRLGYTYPECQFDDKAKIHLLIHAQSHEISVGVDDAGAGDQGMMFGFACNETKSQMPLPIMLAHRLAEAIDHAREDKSLAYLRPDGKTQVTVAYQGDKPTGIDSVVLAVPHDEKVELPEVAHDLYKEIVTPVLEEFNFSFPEKDVIVNGTGIWHIGGPHSDTGLTGRKIIVDTYGGYARVGGGAFSGKDPSKVDRSGAYAARYIAKNIVAAGLADRAEVRLAYFIGAKRPLMQEVETFGTAKAQRKVIKDFSNKLLDTSVRGIIEGLDLLKPIYKKSAAYGHFGRDIFPWEKIV